MHYVSLWRSMNVEGSGAQPWFWCLRGRKLLNRARHIGRPQDLLNGPGTQECCNHFGSILVNFNTLQVINQWILNFWWVFGICSLEATFFFKQSYFDFYVLKNIGGEILPFLSLAWAPRDSFKVNIVRVLSLLVLYDFSFSSLQRAISLLCLDLKSSAGWCPKSVNECSLNLWIECMMHMTVRIEFYIAVGYTYM